MGLNMTVFPIHQKLRIYKHREDKWSKIQDLLNFTIMGHSITGIPKVQKVSKDNKTEFLSYKTC
jgi:hypothetical protein